MNIATSLQSIYSTLPAGVRLVAVSKTHPAEEILRAYNCGHRIFGENKAQELASKATGLPLDIEWHFIGHLQTNKVRLIAPFVHTVHSIESLRLLSIINLEALKVNRIINCLLQFHIATEETKFGLDLNQAHELLQSKDYVAMKNIHITGVMGMATNTSNNRLVRSEFSKLRRYFELLSKAYFAGDDTFCEISMGMSADYLIAMQEGSTIVRIGSALFGER